MCYLWGNGFRAQHLHAATLSPLVGDSHEFPYETNGKLGKVMSASHPQNANQLSSHAAYITFWGEGVNLSQAITKTSHLIFRPIGSENPIVPLK